MQFSATEPTQTESRVIIVANRGPATFARGTNGNIITRPAHGGLATALVAAATRSQLFWIAIAGNETERQAFTDRPYRTVQINDASIMTRYVPVPERAYELYYNDISNRILWFLQHYLLHPDEQPNFTADDQAAWEEGYVAVNQAAAEAVIAEVRALPPAEQENTAILVQDYHLYLVPGMIRAALPHALIGHFVHIPWPDQNYWNFLPHDFVHQILASLVQSDIVGFQTPTDAQRFLTCAGTFLPEAQVERFAEQGQITYRGHQAHAQAYPIGIDPDQVEASASSPSGQRGFAGIAKWFDRRTILRVDRLEPTKNIVRGLQAFERMLALHPEMRARVRFVMLLVPSREGVIRYRRYARRVKLLVEHINATYATPEDPIVLEITGNNQARALAAMQCCDTMLVNSIIDGMHLGAKEMAVVNQQDGVLVVSRNAGVYRDLRDGACLPVSPTDIEETARALYDGLTMPPTQRRIMAAKARRRCRSHTVIQWLAAQLHDLFDVAETTRATAERDAMLQPVQPLYDDIHPVEVRA